MESGMDKDVRSQSPSDGDPGIAEIHSYASNAPAVREAAFVQGRTLYARLQRAGARFGVEPRGIERVPEDERTDASVVKVGTMWFSVNMVVPSVAVGALAVPVYGLGFVDSFLIILFINMLGIVPVCFFSTLGPRLGLRQMVLSRYYFGYYGVRVLAILVIIGCQGWSVIAVIIGGQLIHAVNHNVPGDLACIVLGACVLFVTLFGYKAVHIFMHWAWLPFSIVSLIVLGEFIHSGRFINLPMKTGEAEAGSVLGFAASVFGFATAWTYYAADYTVYQPVDISRVKVFSWAYAGLMVSLCFTEWLGLALATATMDSVDTSFSDAYTEGNVGGLLEAVLVPPLGHFGQFCLVILAVGTVAGVCPNSYSLTFSFQLLTHHAEAVPRFVLTVVSTVIYCAIAVPAYSHFQAVLQNLLLLIGYWVTIYEAIALTEHFIFKKRQYDLSIWNSPAKLPPGIAAMFAFCFGVFGAVMGMAQVWLTGPVGKLAGLPGVGGDVGFELAFVFAAVTYLPARYLEKRYFKR